jgi:hypothetical protein
MNAQRIVLREQRAEDVPVEDLLYLSNDEVEEGYAEIHQAASAMEAKRLSWLAEVDERRTWAARGHLSTVSWLAQRFGIGRGAAAADTRTARALKDMPAVREALASGEVSPPAVRVLAEARQASPEAFARSERLLLEGARSLSLEGLRTAVAYWRQAVDSAGAERDAEGRWRRRRLHLSPTAFGMVRIDGDLDPETGETVLTAVRACVDAPRRAGSPAASTAASPTASPAAAEPSLTPAQRRADALGEICRQWLDRAHRPHVGGERPHVSVMVDVAGLRGEPASPSELAHTGPVPAETVRRIACDATLSRVMTMGRSEPLDVGRRTPVVPAAIRRAVTVRDATCRFPGCDRPPLWCDAHHVVHWADGGRTALDNLVLVCRRHHRMVHEGGFRLEMTDGRPSFRTPDGLRLSDRGPP